MDSAADSHCWVGCPIRRSPDQSLLAAPRGLSQRATSFIASQCQGIHQMPLSRLISRPSCAVNKPVRLGCPSLPSPFAPVRLAPSRPLRGPFARGPAGPLSARHFSHQDTVTPRTRCNRCFLPLTRDLRSSLGGPFARLPFAPVRLAPSRPLRGPFARGPNIHPHRVRSQDQKNLSSQCQRSGPRLAAQDQCLFPSGTALPQPHLPRRTSLSQADRDGGPG